MLKEEFYKKVAQRADSTIYNTKKFVTAMEDTVMEIIALEDKVTFSFGTIGGRFIPSCNRGVPFDGSRKIMPDRHGQPYYKPSKMAKEY